MLEKKAEERREWRERRDEILPEDVKTKLHAIEEEQRYVAAAVAVAVAGCGDLAIDVAIGAVVGFATRLAGVCDFASFVPSLSLTHTRLRFSPSITLVAEESGRRSRRQVPSEAMVFALRASLEQ